MIHQPRLIELEGISVRYDDYYVLRNASLTVNRGDFMAITGPNGGGKTTLLRIMLRLLKPDSGSVRYYDNAGNPVKGLHIGYLPQKNNIDTRFPITVGEVVKSGLLRGAFGRIGRQDMEKYECVCAQTGIEKITGRQIGSLSGGQLQRTLLARAIISDPEVLMLDEPLSYVDKQFEHQIYSMMETLSQRMTIVLVSHELSIISGMATRHIIVDHGIKECAGDHHHIHLECDCDGKDSCN